MSRINSSVQELFLQLGERPATRSARADSLFRRLRETEEDKILGSFVRAPNPRTLRRNPFRRDE
jgi:hypothetical protein